MTIQDLQNAGIEIQSEVIYCYYDYEVEKRVPITREETADQEIRYIYCENERIYIEVEGKE